MKAAQAMLLLLREAPTAMLEAQCEEVANRGPEIALHLANNPEPNERPPPGGFFVGHGNFLP